MIPRSCGVILVTTLGPPGVYHESNEYEFIATTPARFCSFAVQYDEDKSLKIPYKGIKIMNTAIIVLL